MKNLTDLTDRNLDLIEAAIELAHTAVDFAESNEPIEIGTGGAQYLNETFGKLTAEEWNLAIRIFQTTARKFAADPDMVFEV